MGSFRIAVKSYTDNGQFWAFWEHWQLKGSFGLLVFIPS